MVILTFQNIAVTMGIFHSNHEQEKKRVEKREVKGHQVTGAVNLPHRRHPPWKPVPPINMHFEQALSPVQSGQL